MTKQTAFALVLLGLLMTAPPADADGLFYLAGKVSTTAINADLGDSLDLILDGDDEGAAFGLGLALGKHLVFELSYHDFGSVPALPADCPPGCLAPLATDTTAVSLAFLPHLYFTDSFAVYGKVGLVSWETRIDEIAPGLENAFDEHSDEDLVWGGGLRYLLPGPIGVFTEFERVADSFETISVGATLGF